MTEKIISFDSQERLLTKTRGYLSAVDEMIRDGDRSVQLLLRAFAVADDALKIKIVIMLGTCARSRVAWSLLDIMHDPGQSDNIRQAAAIQISVIAPRLKDKEALTKQLLHDLEADAPFVRAMAAFALGWEGNLRAAPELIDCLCDGDIDVQQAAVNALSNLHDENLFALLAQRLQISAKEQQRSILYNLVHFPSHQGAAAQLCRAFLQHKDPDLRYDALVVLRSLTDPLQELDLYARCLDDSDARIRELVLMRLQAVERRHLAALLPKIRPLVSDPRRRVRQAATQLICHIEPIALAGACPRMGQS
jgi:HEAT repeat protein